MKKFLSILLCGIMILGLVGCSKNENSAINSTSNAIKDSTTNEINKTKEEPKDEALVKKAEEQLEKDIEESKKIYADYINEVSNLYQDIKIKYIVQNRDDIGNLLEGNAMIVNIDIRESNDEAFNRYSEFTVKEKSNLVDKNITDITVFFYNKGENKGMLISDLKDEEYITILNTLN